MNSENESDTPSAADSSCREGKSRHLVDKLLDERARVLALLCEAGDVIPDQESSATTVSRLCDVLIDYLAASHFALLQHVSSGEERRSPLAEEGQRAYPLLLESTDAALEFNDRFGNLPRNADAAPLREALSSLGEKLAERFEIEDRLITALVTADNATGEQAGGV